MKYKQLITLPILCLALSQVSNAGQVPIISSINNFAVPTAQDYSFNDRAVSVSVAPKAAAGPGYTVTATGTGNVTFYGVTPATSFAGSTTTTGYSLTANFSAAGQFETAGSILNINGTLSSQPLGSTGSPTGVLYSANLTGFGTNPNQAAIGFTTQFNPSWSNQALLTGGSTGEVVYLFDQVGLNNGGHGRLSALINAIQANNLASLNGKTFTGVESIATVPVPLASVLFGTGLTALIGLGRKRLS